MTAWVSENRLDDDLESFRDQFLGNDSESFVGNGGNFPLDVLLAVRELATPLNVPLSFAIDIKVSPFTSH